MEPDEIEQLLVRTARLTEENHRILRKMQRAENVRTFMRVVQWVIVLGSFVALYYLIQPYIAELNVLLESSQSLFRDTGNNGMEVEQLERLMELFDTSDAGTASDPNLDMSQEEIESE